MSLPTSNTTANFVKNALFEDYYDSFDVITADSNWSLTHSSLFVKNFFCAGFEAAAVRVQLLTSSGILQQMDRVMRLPDSDEHLQIILWI
ncbi:hypothetical protein RCL_jg14181.t1 [Rhizophagus clarus]|uniref:Uncharacterized protein n=1 Tax=Rhizophagus clarus TaxID=94130 RepID=A0A8H3QRX3_9GLOM|nr:hypothetical protein RCL_jg14181.t1 [Rhizophagus clarus]